MDSKNIKYLILTIILLILSVFGVFLIFQIKNSSTTSVAEVPEVVPTEAPQEIIPTKIPKMEITPIATDTSKISTSSTQKLSPTPSLTATQSSKLKISPTPSLIPTVTATTSSQLTYKSTQDGFSIDYSSLRKVYQDKETTGNRYTFSGPSGNFAVHVAPSGTWSWTNTDRNFSGSLIVSGQNTFRYDISTQTIVDLQSSTKNYTIQCIHVGKEALKTECEAFIKSFKLL